MTNLRLRNPAAPRLPWRLIACASLTVGAVAAWTAVRPAPPDRAGSDPMASEVDGPDPGVGPYRDLYDRRREVVEAVLRGELGLQPAAARFRELTAAAPRAVGHLRRVYAGATDDERCARAVIGWVRTELVRRGKDLGPADRLEAELARLLAAGPLTLPAPAGPRTE